MTSKDIFENLSDNELIRDISKINKNQLETTGTMAYVEIYNRVLNLKTLLEEDKFLLEKVAENEELFKETGKFIKENILDLDIVLSKQGRDTINVESLKDERKNIVKMARALTSYLTEISYVNDITKDIVYIDFIKENAIVMEEKIDYEKLFENIQMFLAEDARNIKFKVRDIVSILPIRITKSKYWDMIYNAFYESLTGASEEMIDTIMNRYKLVFDGTLSPEYGVYFDHYFKKSEKFRNFDFKNAMKEELNNIYEETLNTMDNLNRTLIVLREYGIVINRLIAVKLLEDNIQGRLNNDDIGNLKMNWNNYLESGDKHRERVVDEYDKIFKKLEKEFQENNEQLQILTMENVRRKNKIDDSLKDSLEKTQYVLSYINDYSLEKEDIENTEYFKEADGKYLKKTLENWIEVMNRSIEELSNAQRKARMKKLASVTEGLFATPNEFFEYLANSINLTRKDEELVSVVNSIVEVIDSYRKEANNNRSLRN